MKLSCEIVEDLMPLYLDEVCSQKSREAIEEHMKGCQHCRELVKGEDALSIPPIKTSREDIALKNSLKKIRHRWWLSVIAIFMIFPVVILGIFVRNEMRGEGITFSNLMELWNCNGFLKALRERDGRKAASYMDFSSYYTECREALEMTPEDYMPKLTEIVIEGQSWLVYESVTEQYGYTPAPDFWTAVIENEDPGAMIPVEEFLSVTGKGDASEIEDGGFRMASGTCYLLYETEKGRYLLHEEAWDLLKEENMLLIDCVDMIPAELYYELEPTLKERAQTWCRNNFERLKEVADLDRDEFCSYMQGWYGERLEQFLGRGISLNKYGYETVYTGDQGWEMSFSTIMERNGQEERVRFVFHLENNKIHSLYAMEEATYAQEYDMVSPRF